MHVRHATARDLSRIAELSTISFQDDPTFFWLRPWYDAWPSDTYFYESITMKQRLYDAHTQLLVMVTDTEEAGEEESVPQDQVIAYCVWNRYGKGRRARKWWRKKNTWVNRIDSLIAKIERWSLKHKGLERRDLSAARLKALNDGFREIDERYFSSKPERWVIDLLVTDRAWRQRGAASRLIEWGTDRADQEGIGCEVVSSTMGKPVYEGCGFKCIGDYATRVPGEGEEESIGAWVMWRSERSQEKRKTGY